MKTKLAILALACLVLTSGCSTVGHLLTPANVKVAVSAATSFGLEQYPDATPYVATAGKVICAAANSTNVSPAEVVAELEAAGVGANPYAKLIVNSVIAIYDGVFESFGADWVNSKPQLVAYLKAVCDGITDGLPAEPATASRRVSRPKILPPHLK
jgi:hypothetical protein